MRLTCRLLLALSMLPFAAFGQPTPEKGMPKITDLSPDIREEINKKDPKELVKELKKAAKLTPEGLVLLRDKIYLGVVMSGLRSQKQNLIDDPAVKRVVDTLARDGAQFAAIQREADGVAQRKSMDAFLEKYQLDENAFPRLFDLQQIDERLGKYETTLVVIDQQMLELERRAQVARPVDPGSRGVMPENLKAEDIINRYKTGGTTGTTPTPMPMPTTRPGNLNYLKNIKLPK